MGSFIVSQQNNTGRAATDPPGIEVSPKRDGVFFDAQPTSLAACVAVTRR